MPNLIFPIPPFRGVIQKTPVGVLRFEIGTVGQDINLLQVYGAITVS